MAKSIDTLVEDIQLMLRTKLPAKYAAKFGAMQMGMFQDRFCTDIEPPKTILRMSKLGQKCKRQLAYEEYELKHLEDKGVSRPRGSGDPSLDMMFSFGSVIENLVLVLAEAAGHTVECVQEPLEIDGITGSCDAVIDGCVVDIKTCSDYSFGKITSGGLKYDDPFGYLSQASSYYYALKKGGKIPESLTPKAYFLCINKTTGEMGLVDYVITTRVRSKTKEIKEAKDAVKDISKAPRGYDTTKRGVHPVLGAACSRCKFKWHCWPGLRAFRFESKGKPDIKYVTDPEARPSVPEVTERVKPKSKKKD